MGNHFLSERDEYLKAIDTFIFNFTTEIKRLNHSHD
ncbi:MAG: hypothetical protein ACJAZY_003433 [Spirosomataceae bacterium]|jgi:hypothetical protein